MNWNNVNGNGMTSIGNKLGLFLDYGRSPHALVSQRVYSPIYIRIKMAKITRMKQKGLKKIKEIQVKEFV